MNWYPKVIYTSINKYNQNDKQNCKNYNSNHFDTHFQASNNIKELNSNKKVFFQNHINMLDLSFNPKFPQLSDKKTNSFFEIENMKDIEKLNTFYQSNFRSEYREKFRIETTQINNKLNNLAAK